MKKILSVLLIVCVMMMTLAGCGSDTTTEGSMLINEGQLLVGVDDTYPPMEFLDENGERVGFDIDLANAIGEELGVDVVFVSTAWDSIFTGLQAKNYDVIISSVSMQEDRLENMELSIPYLANGQVIVVKPGDESIETPEDLAGKKVGVQFETTSDIACQKHLETVDFELTQFDTIDQTFLAMESNNIDCIVVDMAVAIDYVAKKPEHFVISSASLTNEPIAVAIDKGNLELKEEIDMIIEQFKEDGTLKSISEKWLSQDYTTNIDEELR